MYTISTQQIIEDVQDLPTLPAVVMEILNNIDKEDVDTHELADKVAHDSALTAKTLKQANSAYYSTMVKVTTIQQAISLLGLVTVRQIIISAALSGCFPENNCSGFSHKNFWRHSNLVAIVARILARRLKFNQEVAYTAGLLHDIGTLVLVSKHSTEYAAALLWQQENTATQLHAERHVLGTDHAAVGEALAQEWNFSEQMIQAIAGHHHPERPGAGFLASIVHVANGITHALGPSGTQSYTPPEINGVSWESSGLDQQALDEVLEEAKTEFLKLEQDIAI
ncbi:HDOD domain-containing protein [Undibacterium crateris]|uniref:HDOD domain-containing protein n=1 Tax=Undibacterium crateris TaxID=2528175 RepID=UPI001389FDAF|nr:HDOD domain-containing protein [Undibacterium crateris]NDI85923.1 HDOD domain-containing protein [Undibacterium crateris]